MKAIIMAGGEGTRLRPLTCTIPKPMVPVMNRPVMEHIINLLKKHGITEIGVTVQYCPEPIVSYFGDGEAFGVHLTYYYEDSPLGTAGSVKNAEEMLNEPFIVISGDALTDLDITKAIRFHEEKKATATLVLTKVEIPLDYGVVITNEEGRIVRFIEKPQWSEVFSDTVNTGIYILDPSVLKLFPKNQMYDFGKDLFPLLLRQNAPMFGHIMDDYWCDIGDLDAYARCHEDVLQKKVSIRYHANEVLPGVYMESGVKLEREVKLHAPCWIGENTHLYDDVVVEPFSVIGQNCVIGNRASVKKGILWSEVKVNEKAALRGCTIASKTSVGKQSEIYEGAVIGEKCILGEKSVIKPSIRLWPSKTVDSGATVSANLVWGQKTSKTLFGDRGIHGEINVDITPEFATKVGAAFGAMLGEKTKIGISTDDQVAVNMFKQALIAGLMSAGVQVMDFGVQTLPGARFGVAFFGLIGGVYISVGEDGQLIMDFLGKEGLQLHRSMERKLENIFAREDFKRAEMAEIYPVTQINDLSQFYIQVMGEGIGKLQEQVKVAVVTSSMAVREALSTVGAQVGVNPYFCDSLSMLPERVKQAKCVMGIWIAPNGETYRLFDEKGKEINRRQLDSIFAQMLSEEEHIVLTSDVSSQIRQSVGNRAVQSKSELASFMQDLVKHARYQHIFGDPFLLRFDAVGAVFKIASFLEKQNQSLSQMVANIPPVYMEDVEVFCPDTQKGKVMRQLITLMKENGAETNEGIKILKKGGWALILPHSEKPVFRIVTEGIEQKYAKELSDELSGHITSIVENK